MKRLALSFVVLAILAPSYGAGPEVKIIAHPALPVSEISAGDLRSIYLGFKTSLKDSGPVQPVLTRNAVELDQFAVRYLGKSGSALQTYYRSLVFTGKRSLAVAFNSDQQIIDYVARTPGAIAFVHGDTPTDRVKTLQVR